MRVFHCISSLLLLAVAGLMTTGCRQTEEVYSCTDCTSCVEYLPPSPPITMQEQPARSAEPVDVIPEVAPPAVEETPVQKSAEPVEVVPAPAPPVTEQPMQKPVEKQESAEKPTKKKQPMQKKPADSVKPPARKNKSKKKKPVKAAPPVSLPAPEQTSYDTDRPEATETTTPAGADNSRPEQPLAAPKPEQPLGYLPLPEELVSQ